MPKLKLSHDLEYGLSDHSRGHLVSVAATAMGARVIEKHFCLDRDERTTDGAFSMLPDEFDEMSKAVRITHEAISGTNKSMKGNFFKRSILVSSPIPKGAKFTPQNIRVARPGDGLCPSRWQEVLSKFSKNDLEVGHPLSAADLADP